MIIVTSVKTTPAGTLHNGGIVGIGFGNHNPKKSDVLFTFDLLFQKLTETKAIYSSKKEFMDEVMIPAFTKAGSSNPKSMANHIYGQIRKEGKVVELL